MKADQRARSALTAWLGDDVADVLARTLGVHIKDDATGADLITDGILRGIAAQCEDTSGDEADVLDVLTMYVLSERDAPDTAQTLRDEAARVALDAATAALAAWREGLR